MNLLVISYLKTLSSIFTSRLSLNLFLLIFFLFFFFFKNSCSYYLINTFYVYYKWYSVHLWFMSIYKYVSIILCVCMLSYVRLIVTPWTVAHQAPLSMRFCRWEYQSGLPFPTPGKASWPRDGIHVFWVSCIAGRFFTAEPPGEAIYCILDIIHSYSQSSWVLLSSGETLSKQIVKQKFLEIHLELVEVWSNTLLG